MAISGQQKRKKKKAEIVENYYKILGTRSNATAETIKKKYIEKVREFPPETHPEQFQQIRRAYEVLRNPQKRAEYDLQRKYGGKLELLFDQADESAASGDWKKAASLYASVLKADTQSIPALLSMAHCSFHTDTEHTADVYFDRAHEYAKTEEEKLSLLAIQAKMFYQHNLLTEALTALNRIRDTWPDEVPGMMQLYCTVYMELGRNEEAWALLNAHLPTEEEQEADDLGIFIDWMNLLINLNKWNLFSKAQQRIRKFLRSLTDPEDKQMAVDDLMEEHDEYYEVGRYKEALIFVEFANYLDPKDMEVREELIGTREHATIEKEIERMINDEDMYPLITMHAFEWFFEGHLDDEYLYSFRESIPPEVMRQLESNNEGYAYGINRLKKKYAKVYRFYQKEWDLMYAEKTAGFNREQRRSIR